MVKIYSISHCSAHACNHDNAAPIPESDHLLRDGLCCHENARNIYRKHFAGASLALYLVDSL